MKFFGGDDLESVFPAKIKVVFRVDLPAQADLQNIFADQQPFLHRAPHRSAMGMRASEIATPGVVVRVELDQTDGAEAFVDGPQNGQEDGMVAADANGSRSRLENVIELGGNPLKRVFDG